MSPQSKCVDARLFLKNCFKDSNYCLEEFRRLAKMQPHLLDYQREVLQVAISKHQRVETLILYLLCNFAGDANLRLGTIEPLQTGLGMLDNLTQDAEAYCGLVDACFSRS